MGFDDRLSALDGLRRTRGRAQNALRAELAPGLQIGLGLVNALNLTEFKAVLAHEFGHFSQRTMKLGSYVYILNHVITDMTYGRDSWDNALAIWRSIDLRLSFFAWILTAVVWVIRLVMKGAFRVINLLDASLSRQMEFNADLVAVRVSGSDQIVNALGRLEFADQCLSQAFFDLRHAADRGHYSRDVFFHQTRASKFVRKLRKDETFGILPPAEGPESRIFEAGDDTRPSMWASHPPNHEREANAKRLFIAGLTDERSPWELFADPAALREKMTRHIFRLFEGDIILDKDFKDPEEVQAFIDVEHGDAFFDEKYRGVYDRRFLRVPDVEVLAADKESAAPSIDDLYTEELAERVQKYHDLLDDLAILRAGARGELGKKFVFQDEEYRIKDAEDLITVRNDEVTTHEDWFKEFDQRVFRAYLQATQGLGIERRAVYMDRYRCQEALFAIFHRLNDSAAQLTGLLNYLGSGAEFTEQDIEAIRDEFSGLHTDLVKTLQMAGEITLPPLPNVEPGTSVRSLLIKGRLIDDIPFGPTIEGSWINGFCDAFFEIQEKHARLMDKNSSGILAEHEEIAGAHEVVLDEPVVAEELNDWN